MMYCKNCDRNYSQLECEVEDYPSSPLDADKEITHLECPDCGGDVEKEVDDSDYLENDFL